MLLARKSWRQLRRERGQALAVFVVMGLGVMLFVGSAGAYLDLRTSYEHTRRALALADVHVETAPITDADARAVSSLAEVADAEPRAVASVAAVVADRRAELRLLSLPDAGEPRLDRVLVLRGALPQGGEVLLEKHFAERHALDAGSMLEVSAGGKAERLRVSGVAIAAEYLWVARSDADPMPSPDGFGVGWMRRGALAALASDALVALASDAPEDLRVAADPTRSNELLVMAAPGKRVADASAAVARALGAHERRSVDAAHLTGVRLLQMDVDGYEGIATFFPLVFLGVGAFIVASILSRLVDAERAVIGTLLAIGVRASRVLGAYVGHALLLGGLGAVGGALAGFAATGPLTHAYAAELGIPFVVAAPRWGLAAAGVAMGLVASGLAGLLPAWRAARLTPADAMRPPVPRAGAAARALRALPGSMLVRMALRGVVGRPLRSLGTALGVAAALVLVMTSGALLDSMRAVVDGVFQDARRYDVAVDLVAPAQKDAALDRARRVPGVTQAEASLVLPAHLMAHGATQAVVARGADPGASLVRSIDVGGRVVLPAADGIVVTRAIGRSLGVGVGDDVDFEVRPGGRRTRLHVSGFADATLGAIVTLRLTDLERAAELPGSVDSIAVVAAPGRIADVRRALADDASVGRVDDAAATREVIQGAMGFGWMLLGAMLFFSAGLAGAILYNTATLGIVERSREIATVRALGRTLREIAAGILLENALVCAIGLLIGLPLAILSIREVLSLYSSDLFPLPFVLSARTLLAAHGGVVLVLLVSQAPALRQVARADLAEAVRARA
jgi:putative ABC transport system permease protein